MKREDINNNSIVMGKYDVIVIGAGHAGCEAGLASARMGMKTLMLATDLGTVAMMPCNPSIGGTGKGHLVKEIDALGGEMGINIDKTFIQSKTLNTAKGVAVHSTRAQADKNKYHLEMKKTIERQANLFLKQAEVIDLIYDYNAGIDSGIDKNKKEKNKKIAGVVTKTKSCYFAKAVIICTGTFLGGKIFIGEASYASGPSGMSPATELSKNLANEGIELRRFKTGTPARVLGSTLNYDLMQEQNGDDSVTPFSFLNEGKSLIDKQEKCWLTYTNKNTHKIVLDNIEKSAMYSGNIVGVGPRYCPSIEDKVARFKDRERHQLFVEPEGLDTEEMYIQGMSTSLPEDIQEKFYRSIEGLENADIVRPAYAIEYDCINPLQLKPSLEIKNIENLFSAGQFNGSSGYEEAASQGLLAGINAVLKLRGEEPLVLGRDEAYIGVLIDDLVTKGTNEPYRIMTSRAEYRLLLRQSNADARLTHISYNIGLATEDRYKKAEIKNANIDNEVERLKKVRLKRQAINNLLNEKNLQNIGDNIPSLYELIKRPEIHYSDITKIDKNSPKLSYTEKLEVEARIKYSGYIEKQMTQVAKMNKLENKKIRKNIDYNSIKGLRLEARQKLMDIEPMTLGQASRISGVSPSDINVLLVYLEKEKRLKENVES